jgi:hypothetical protein
LKRVGIITFHVYEVFERTKAPRLMLDRLNNKYPTNLVLNGTRSMKSGQMSATRLAGDSREGMMYEGTMEAKEQPDSVGEVSYIDVKLFYSNGHLPQKFVLHASCEIASRIFHLMKDKLNGKISDVANGYRGKDPIHKRHRARKSS